MRFIPDSDDSEGEKDFSRSNDNPSEVNKPPRKSIIKEGHRLDEKLRAQTDTSATPQIDPTPDLPSAKMPSSVPLPASSGSKNDSVAKTVSDSQTGSATKASKKRKREKKENADSSSNKIDSPSLTRSTADTTTQTIIPATLTDDELTTMPAPVKQPAEPKKRGRPKKSKDVPVPLPSPDPVEVPPEIVPSTLEEPQAIPCVTPPSIVDILQDRTNTPAKVPNYANSKSILPHTQSGPRHKVGLSRRQRVEPLLSIVRK